MENHRVPSCYDGFFIRNGDSLYDTLYSELSKVVTNPSRSSMRLTRYGVGDYISMHDDMGPLGQQVKRRTTVVVQINDPIEYEGGDLVFEDGRVLERRQGAYVVFSPYEKHEVQPVTKGVRYSLSWWIT